MKSINMELLAVQLEESYFHQFQVGFLLGLGDVVDALHDFPMVP